MAKKQLDKLSLDMIQCEKDGYGVWYGRWKATQPIKKPEPPELPDGWKVCLHCGKHFKPKVKQQKYCEVYCGYKERYSRYGKSRAEYIKEYRAKKKAELGV